MDQLIKLEIIDDKIKVISPYNSEFVRRAKNFRGKWKNGAWWFDDSILEYVREAMIEIYGTTGEKPYKTCSLLIRHFTDHGEKGPVTLFGRTVAKAFGRDSGAKLGDDIILISGKCTSGGSMKNWSTVVDDATFEIQNFPVPRTKKEDVQEAIQKGWCEIKRIENSGEEITKISWNDPELYSIIGPYAMSREVIREADNPITTDENMEWYLEYEDEKLKGFCSVEKTQSSWAIKNFYTTDHDESRKFKFIKYILDEFNDSDISKLYCLFRTSQLNEAKKHGFKEVKHGKNWHRFVLLKNQKS